VGRLNSFGSLADVFDMRILIGLVLALLAAPVVAQDSYRAEVPDSTMRHDCLGREIKSGAEFNEVASITKRLAVADPRIRVAVAMNPMINAWEVPGSELICVPVAFVHFMESEGELAFMIGHEMGHAIDKRCDDPASRAQITDQSKSGALLGLLFGRGSGDGARDQRACESRADELGLSLMTRAGYDPEDAVLALMRLSSYVGDTGTGPIARLAALGNDHPITADRVRHVRKLIARQAKASASVKTEKP
jgi:predicted Zn-dependent protease